MIWYDKQPPLQTQLLTRFSMNAQLGVSVEFQETDLKKAYRKAAMKVPDLVSQVPRFELSNEAFTSATVARSRRCM